VSRGLLRSVAAEGRGRRAYFREDVERLRARHRARAGHAAVASGALRWGEPVLDSALTEIGPAGPRYRGRDARALVEERVPFEAAAEWLWTQAPIGERRSWSGAWPLDPARIARLLPPGARPLEALAVAVPALAAADEGRHGASAAAELDRARRLVRGLAAALALPGSPARARAAQEERTVAAALLVALGQRRRPGAERAVNEALVLCADHELNPSTFAARVASSTGADLYACVSAALAALSGPLHGGAGDRVERLVEEAGSAARAAATVDARLRRGEAVPGFGHPLYAGGDPRGRLLLERARLVGGRSAPLRTLLAIVQAMHDRGREGPTLDVGLVALASALSLPRGSAVGVFAVGRAAGWIAHALEQRAADFVLRPRARYVGPPVAPVPD